MKNILLILGAGSSKSIDKIFPIGVELAQVIDHHLITTKKELTDVNYEIECPYISPMINQINRTFKSTYNFNTKDLDIVLENFKRHLWGYVQEYIYNDMRIDTPPISIDQLVSGIKGHYSTQIRDIAKFSIAYHLKGSERAFFQKLETDPKILKTNWVYHLFKKLKNQFDSLEQLLECLHIRTFNYERLFEFCAKKSLTSLYELSPEESDKLKLNITTAYGDIGSLLQLPFGFNNDRTEAMMNVHETIKLIGERVNPDNFNISDYEMILFLGFGYNESNIEEALGIKPNNLKECFGNCYQSKGKTLNDIDKKYNIRIEQVNIQTLIDQHIVDYD